MPISNQKEEIDSRILSLIGLEDVFDLDYETYLTLLKEAMVKGRMTKKTIPTEEIMLLTDEYKRVKSKKDNGRFEVKKKKITAGSFSIGGIKGQITGTATKALPGAAIGTSPLTKSLENNISAIASAVVSISETLKQQKKISDDTSAYNRKKAEQEKRGLAESKLEKRFEGLKKAAEKIIAPVKSLLDRIIQFFTTVLLGRIVYKLVEWLGNPENASKVKSIIRFLKDWGPALLGGFILFGTKFGKGVRILTKIALSGIAKLAKAIPSLLRFAKGNPKTALALATGAYATTQLAQRAFTSENSGKDSKPKVEGRAGGGSVSVVKFAGGGFNFGGFGKFFSGFGKFFSGLVSGEKGVDKIPAMLSDGEFVMSRGAVAKYGVDTLESMNAAGGGTNKPKIVSGVPYAAGGGLMGGVGELRKKYDREHGEGAYDRESARRRASANATEEKSNLPPVKTGSQFHRMQRQAGIISFDHVNNKKSSSPGSKKPPSSQPSSISADNIAKSVSSSAQGLVSSISASTGAGSGGLTAEQQRRINADNAQRNSIMQQGQQRRDASKEARAEYLKILRDQSHPLHDKAAFGDLSLSEFKKNYKPTIAAAPTTPAAATGSKPGMGYTPYQSKFAGARDAAFAKARTMGGSPAFKSQDYYKANTAAREKQLSGLTSQQRLNALSLEGKNPRGSKGRRFDAQAKAQSAETSSRGGMMGQLGRSFTKMFGSEKDKIRVAAQDKASDARVKQAGAASIGRYYSSSDGKYYKNYNAAKLAQKQRKKSGVKPPVKPKPKYNPAGGGMGGARGSRGSKSKVKTPTLSASTKGSKTKADLIGVHR